MSMYYCDKCDKLKDDDWEPAAESPFSEFGLLCPECEAELKDAEPQEGE